MRVVVLACLALAVMTIVASAKNMEEAADEGPAGTVFDTMGLSDWAQTCIDQLLCLERMRFGAERRGHYLQQMDTNTDVDMYYSTHLDWQALLLAVRRFAQFSMENLSNAEDWFGRVPGFSKDFFNVDNGSRYKFAPFVERVDVAPGSRVVLFGDLHGSVHSLLRDLTFLKQQGYIQDDWRISPRWHGRFYIVFLGDYVDRGLYGVEVIYTLLRLRMANPRGVFMSRGNHEDAGLNHGDFQRELDTKYSGAAPPAELAAVYRLYDFLPVAVYLHLPDGQGPEANQNILCCHGGLEIGYEAAPFLVSGKRFEKLYGLYRRAHYERLPSTVRGTVESQAASALTDLDPEGGTDGRNVWPSGHVSAASLGFMWSDFFVDDDKTGLGYSSGRGFIYGKPLTEHLNHQANITAVFRAHQHNNSPKSGPMLDNLRTQHGMVGRWGSAPQVYTFLSASEVPVFQLHIDAMGFLDVHGGDHGPDRSAIRRCYRPVGPSSLRSNGFLQCEQFVQDVLAFECSCQHLNTWTPCNDPPSI